MEDHTLRDTLLEVIESTLDAQLRAVRRLRTSSSPARKSLEVARLDKSGMSQIDMAYDILSSGQPLHINEILEAIKKRFRVEVDRESLVSALSKRIVRGDRFRRSGKNVFALLAGKEP
jgi:hypothetical protein